MTDKQRRDLRALVEIAQLVAIEDAADIPTSEADARSDEAAARFARDGMAALRRSELGTPPAWRMSGAIRESIQRLTRAQALARLGELLAQHPTIQVAYRDFQGITDDDVRSALEDVEWLLEQGDG